MYQTYLTIKPMIIKPFNPFLHCPRAKLLDFAPMPIFPTKRVYIRLLPAGMNESPHVRDFTKVLAEFIV